MHGVQPCPPPLRRTGIHSYGKTPLFYAITRCRDEVVELLLARGARTRILNNKGQSVLSLAATHLTPSVVSAVEAAEAAEGELPERWLQRLHALAPEARPLLCPAGWVDFQSSHPDGQTYGDLDPRFYTALTNGDVATRLAINPTSREGRRLHKHLPGSRSLASPGAGSGCDGQHDEAAEQRRLRHGDLATGLAPIGGVGRAGVATSEEVLAAALDEALRPLLDRLGATGGDAPTAESVVELSVGLVAALSSHKGAWLTAAAIRVGRSGATTGLLRKAAARVGSGAVGAKLCRRLLLQAAKAPSEAQAAAAKARASAAETAREREQFARRTALAAAEEQRVERLLRTAEVVAPVPTVVWVDDMVGMRALQEAVGSAVRVGVDTEWTDLYSVDGQPVHTGPAAAVVATLQIAVEDATHGERSFVCEARVRWDEKAGSGGGAGGGRLSRRSEYNAALASVVRRIFLEAGAPRPVGFAFATDATKLTRWLADVQGEAVGLAGAQLAIRQCTIDVQRLAENSGLGSRSQAPSLQATCAHWLAHRVDKQEQCSDWAARPLSLEQISYAATDASACLRLLDAMMADWPDHAAVPLDERL